MTRRIRPDWTKEKGWKKVSSWPGLMLVDYTWKIFNYRQEKHYMYRNEDLRYTNHQFFVKLPNGVKVGFRIER